MFTSVESACKSPSELITTLNKMLQMAGMTSLLGCPALDLWLTMGGVIRAGSQNQSLKSPDFRPLT